MRVKRVTSILRTILSLKAVPTKSGLLLVVAIIISFLLVGSGRASPNNLFDGVWRFVRGEPGDWYASYIVIESGAKTPIRLYGNCRNRADIESCSYWQHQRGSGTPVYEFSEKSVRARISPNADWVHYIMTLEGQNLKAVTSFEKYVYRSMWSGGSYFEMRFIGALHWYERVN